VKSSFLWSNALLHCTRKYISIPAWDDINFLWDPDLLLQDNLEIGDSLRSVGVVFTNAQAFYACLQTAMMFECRVWKAVPQFVLVPLGGRD